VCVPWYPWLPSFPSTTLSRSEAAPVLRGDEAVRPVAVVEHRALLAGAVHHADVGDRRGAAHFLPGGGGEPDGLHAVGPPGIIVANRKSTRLNSSHVSISYAAF